MLQSTVRSQLARIESHWNFGKIRHMMEVNYPAPLTVALSSASNTLEYLSADDKHWFIGGNRSLAIAIKLLEAGKVIALPTDTIYGFAGLAQNTQSVERLYEIKGRDKSKPLAICLSSIKDIRQWGEIDHLPPNLISALLPGPVTIILKRKPSLNPSLNPGVESVAIRVTTSPFARVLAKRLGQPLALTSANLSSEPSSLKPEEFSHLWPQLDGIFYPVPNHKLLEETRRVGSTIVDLVTPNKFKIIRRGIGLHVTIGKLRRHGLNEDDT